MPPNIVHALWSSLDPIGEVLVGADRASSCDAARAPAPAADWHDEPSGVLRQHAEEDGDEGKRYLHGRHCRWFERMSRG